MPHPNPPAKQNLDKKGLLTISNSAYCNIHLVYGYILNHPALNLRKWGGGGGATHISHPYSYWGGGQGATVHTRQQTNNKKGEEKLQVCMCFHLQ